TERTSDESMPDFDIISAELKTKKQTGILDFVKTIETAAEDPSVKFIYMNLEKLDAGMTHLEEIRDALGRFRESGKPIIAYADNYSQGGYYIASVADKIYLNPLGSSSLSGISISTLFLKDLLDNLGIEAQLIRHGKFKAAAEQFISNKMSIENREQLQAYIDAVWDTWTGQISESRGISRGRIDEIADRLEIVTAKDAMNAGLVDGIMYKDELLDTLRHLFGAEKEEDLKMTDFNNYRKARIKLNLKEKNKIAVLYANGEIVMGPGEKNIASDNFRQLIAKIRKDSSVKAVVLRVNSPGGSAQSSDIIDRELRLLKAEKPLIVSMGDYAASGGYWISANADRIVTNNSTLTGSIGVFSVSFNASKALDKHLSINAETVNTNLHSDIMSAYRPLDEEEISYIRSSVEIIYNQFVELVAEGRGLNSRKVDSIGQGRVWSGYDALRVGLADEKGGLNDAIITAASMSGLESYRVVEYPVIKSQLDRIMEQLGQSTVKAAGMLNNPGYLFEIAYSGLKSFKGNINMARLPYNLLIN
ncbi:MAG: signal peptide peptidase SppA, partial [Bacteroidales bacterium]|nr:signal peptide peptidase SppA [Bacteroidales bacterium]